MVRFRSFTSTLIFLLLLSGCSLNGSMQASGDLLTDPDPVISQKIVQIETNSAGSGSLVSDKTLYPGDQITIYAILRDNVSNYLGNVAVDWTSFGSLGTLNIQLDGKSAIFTASNVGSGFIFKQSITS